MLLRCLDDIELTPVQTNTSPGADVGLAARARAPGRFDIDEECELKATDDSQAIVRSSQAFAEQRRGAQAHPERQPPTRLRSPGTAG